MSSLVPTLEEFCAKAADIYNANPVGVYAPPQMVDEAIELQEMAYARHMENERKLIEARLEALRRLQSGYALSR